MSDKRTEAIATLTEHLDHWKRLLSEGVCTKDEGEKTIKALTFAIESIKVDRAYDLAYEKVDFIEIPEKATNGEMIKAMFHITDGHIDEGASTTYVYTRTGVVRGGVQDVVMLDRNWWNSPYRKEN